MKNTCRYCGKELPMTKTVRKFCNRRCYAKYRKSTPKTRETLCWQCKNTNGYKCSWFSEEMRPVEGWTAKVSPTSDGISYFVIKCPNFEMMNMRKGAKSYDKR